MKRLLKEECGLSFVEILIAILLVALVIVPMLVIFPVRFSTTMKSSYITSCVFLGQKKLEEICRLAVGTNPSYGFERSYTEGVSAFPASYSKYKYMVDDAGLSDIKFIKVTAWYDADGDNQLDDEEKPSVELNTKLARR